jgi:hypothetical protein
MLVDADVMKMLRLKEGRFLDWPSWEATISSMERMLRFFRTCSASARPGGGTCRRSSRGTWFTMLLRVSAYEPTKAASRWSVHIDI